MQKIMQTMIHKRMRVLSRYLALVLCAIMWLEGAAQAQNTGSAVNSPTYTTPGKFNYALTLNGGAAQYAVLPAAVFNFTSSADFTLDYWFNVPALPGGLAVIFSITTATPTASSIFFGLSSTGDLQFSLASTVVGTKSGVTTNAWHHVAWVATGSTHANDYYFDGVLVGSATVTYPATAGAGGYLAQFGTAGYAANVLVDELRVSTIKRYTAAFTPGTSAYTTDASTKALYHFDNDALPNIVDSSVVSSPTLASAGNVLLLGATPTAITLNAPTTGGTAPISYVWQRATLTGSTTGAFTTLSNGSGVSGAISATLVDGSSGLTAGVRYAYKCTITDSAATPVVLTTYSRLAQLGLAPLVIAAAGDSTSAGIAGVSNNTTINPSYIGQSPLDNCAAILRTVRGYRNVTAFNGAVPGSTANSWAASATNNGFTYLPDLLASCGGSFSGVYVFVRLGVNDAQGGLTAANYLANMTTVVNYIVAHGGKVILSYPTWREPGLYGQDGTTQFSEAYTSVLLSYLPQLDSLVNNTTVFAGDKISLYMEMMNPQAYMYYAPGSSSTTPGTIHENALGTLLFGTNDAKAFDAILYPTTATVKLLKTSHQLPRNSRN